LSALSAQAVCHAYLGVRTNDSTGTTGALVASVTAGSPTAAAGLETGDIVTAIGGKAVSSSGDLVAAIAARDPRDSVELTVRRGSGTETLSVTLGTQP
jgi:putative serine protease PepD